MNEYVFHAPFPFFRPSGYRLMHFFAWELLQRDVTAAISTVGVLQPGLHESPFPEIECADKWHRDRLLDAVHIYPEIIGLNPSRARKVVRYFGHHEGYFTKCSIGIEPTDLIFAWIAGFHPRAVPLRVDVIEKEHFYPKTEPGHGHVTWQGKGSFRFPTISPIITREWPESREDLGNLLRKSDYMMSFDSFSLVNLESAICGTPVVLMDHSQPFLMPEIFPSFGIAPTLIEARDRVHLAAPAYDVARAYMQGEIDRFISICEERWPQ